MRARPCVFCRERPAEPAWDPFCSERCKLQDLAKWIDGGYRVPAESVSPESDEEPPDGREGFSRVITHDDDDK